jgi:hypothetical protein
MLRAGTGSELQPAGALWCTVAHLRETCKRSSGCRLMAARASIDVWPTLTALDARRSMDFAREKASGRERYRCLCTG